MIIGVNLPDGQIVDRVRSCYQSTWNLPGIGEIEGQYCFVPDTNKSFEPSFFFSRNWIKDGKLEEPEYGERWGVAEKWTNGACFPLGPCPFEEEAPSQFLLEAGTATNVPIFGCVNCNNASGDWLLDFVDVPENPYCIWRSEFFPICAFENAFWVLRSPYDGATWRIFAPTVTTYFDLVGEWQPFGTNVFARQTTDLGCEYPEEITLTGLL